MEQKGESACRVFSANTPAAFAYLIKKHPASEHITEKKRKHTNGIITVEVHTTHGDGQWHEAWARARLPGSNEYMSFRLKTVWQQCLKICNRKGED